MILDDQQPLSPAQRRSPPSKSSPAARGCPASPRARPQQTAVEQGPLLDVSYHGKDAKQHDLRLIQHATLAAVALGVLALYILLLKPGSQPAMCRQFVQQECFWETPGKGPLVTPKCGKVECAFGPHQAAVLRCPFAASGRFRKVSATACDVGGEDVPLKERILPTCAASCCHGDAPGRFYRPAGDPSRHIWQTDAAANCSYFHYSSGEVLEILSARRLQLAVMGDSLMHQLWVRFVALMREQHTPLDFRIFTHARYTVCREGDAVEVARAGYDEQMRGYNASVQEELVGQIFDGAPPQPPACRQAPLAVDNIQAVFFATQMSIIERYLQLLPEGQRLVLVAGVGNFEKGAEVPGDFLEFLDSLPARGVDLVWVATSTKQAQRHPEFVAAYQARNEVMRAWSAQRRAAAGALFPAYVDFDALSLDPDAPPIVIDDIHYMCYTRYTGQPAKFARSKRARLRDRRHGTPVVGIKATPDGVCRDEMDRNLWQIIFNIILKPEAAPAA